MNVKIVSINNEIISISDCVGSKYEIRIMEIEGKIIPNNLLMIKFNAKKTNDETIFKYLANIKKIEKIKEINTSDLGEILNNEDGIEPSIYIYTESQDVKFLMIEYQLKEVV